MTVVFTLTEEENKKLSYITDSELTDEEKEEQIIFLLHELVHSLPN